MKQKVRRMMRSTIFRQYDARWGDLPYPTRSYPFAKNGCGCCACTHVVIENDKFMHYTPNTLRKYMVDQGFATRGHGTTWDGITRTLKHYGFSPYVYTNMTYAWTQLNKGNRCGVILFRGGNVGGVTWTTGGHYVAFTAYKVINGKHYFYIKDSGARRHDGWYCYERTMKGLVKRIWIVERPESKIKRFIKGDKYTAKQTLNIHTGGSIFYRIVGKLKKGTTITCRRVSKNGRYVEYDRFRWVCGRGKTKTYLE